MDLEEEFQVGAGQFDSVAEHLSWLMRGAAALVKQMCKNEDLANDIFVAAEELRHGITAEGLPLVRLHVPGTSIFDARLSDHGGMGST